jgi:amino acid adenylation domain-containing protein
VGRLIHRTVEHQTSERPDAVAVTFGDEHLTYRALDDRANQLAHALVAAGIRRDEPVAICLDKSLDMVVAQLGILKAGAAFVPIAPSLPAKRIASMMTDARARVVIGHAAWQSLFANVRTMWLDTERTHIESFPTSRPEVAVCGDNLAYIVYTSGSTGRPKGVSVTHDGAMGWLAGAQARIASLDSSDVYLHLQSFSFDLSLHDLFWPLFAGARVVLISEAERRDPLLIIDVIRGRGVTTISPVPTLLRGLVSEEALSRCSSLRRVNVGGEALPIELVRDYYARLPDVPLTNMYGPTECSIGISYWPCPKEPVAIAFGRDWPDTGLLVLDERLDPVPDGVEGELYISGRQVARGYTNAPQLTADRFIPDPFSRFGGRMYRTGDRVRRWHDGSLEFIGRVDHQVKIRGFRVELGEIERAIAGHPLVRETVVVARQRGGAGDQQLVAYIVPTGGGVETDALRAHVGSLVPDYMVPSAFVTLDALPLTASGKLDRAALPLPAPETLVTAGGQPRTGLQATVAAAWAEALALPGIGIDDDVFHLGASSMAAMRVLSRLRRDLGLAIPAAMITAARTVASLASALGELRPGEHHDIGRAPRDRPLPLSYGQETIWLHAMASPGSMYNEPFSVRIHSALDVATLARAFGEVMMRHEILRTTFASVGGEPVQTIHDGAPFELPFVDLGGLHESERWRRAVELATQQARQPFELSRLPLIRAIVFKLGDDDHVLFGVAHHAICDAVSMFDVLPRELERAYRALRTGVALPPPPPLQYADYAVWQRTSDFRDVFGNDLEYWKSQLADLPTLDLPTDRARPAAPTSEGDRICIDLSHDLSTRLRALARDRGVSLFVVLAAAFDVLLSRYTGQDEIVIGTQVDRRDRPELEHVFGYFLNTLVLRTDVSDDPTFGELLSQVSATVQGALAHQALPFARVVEAVKPSRKPGQHPLFQVMFILEPGTTGLPPGWSVGQRDFHGGFAHFDLTFELDDRPEGIIGRIEYSTELFNRTTVERLAASYQRLLDSASRDVEQRVSRLPLLEDPERSALLARWNPEEHPYGPAHMIHRAVEAQVDATPDAVAITLGAQQLTYRALDERANQVAQALVAVGVRRDERVAVCLERSIDMIVLLLGILKAGGAFVPIVPSLPRERVTSMMTDAGARVVVGHAQWQGLFDGVRTLWLDADRARVQSLPTRRPDVTTCGDNLAYVLFTSGSTGRPKGVMVTHDAIMNELLAAQALTGPLDGSDVYIHLAAFSFDLSVHDIFWPLSQGARLVLVAEGEQRDPPRILEIIREQKVTTVFPVPSMLRAFVAEPGLERCTSLRRVIVGGEALRPELVRDFYARLPHVPLTNMYGPTECAMAVSQWRCPADAVGIALGRDWPDTSLYILDEHLEPVPVGVAGELYISGRQVTRGYANAPHLTADRFVPDPWSQIGRRMYRTGDRVRRWEDGDLEFVGRADDQVKIRGLRIELAEIESALASHPAVRDAVVIVRERQSLDHQLVAYVLARAGGIDAADLRRHLAALVPDYMVPSAFVTMDAFPVSASGKVDRKALPAPPSPSALERVEPRTALEEVLAAVWRDVLEVDQIGAFDDFFELGGHSLLAVRVLAQVVELFECTLPMSSFFRASTLAELAVEVSKMLPPGRADELSHLILEASVAGE